MRRHTLAITALALAALSPGVADARQTGRSFLDVDVDTHAHVATLRLELPARDLADYQRIDSDGDGVHTAADIAPASAAAQTLGLVLSHLSVWADGAPCVRATGARVAPTRPTLDAAFLMTFQCARAIGDLRVVNRLMTNDRWGYQHYGTLRAPGVDPLEVVFDIELAAATITVDPDPEPPTPNPLRAPAPLLAMALAALAAAATWAWARR